MKKIRQMLSDLWYWFFPRPEVGTIRRTSPKVGRNEPCGCGSKLKYKRCCGRQAPPLPGNFRNARQPRAA